MWVKKNVGQKKFGSNFFLHESSSWVKIGLHAENQLPGWSGSGLKVCVVGGGWVGGGGWVLTHNLVKPTLLVKVELGFDKMFAKLHTLSTKRSSSQVWAKTPHFQTLLLM